MTYDPFNRTSFAGFNLPRVENGPTIHNPTATPLAKRLADYKRHGRGCIGPVTFPNQIRTPDTSNTFKGWGTYMKGWGEIEIADLRWEWCDELPRDWMEFESVWTGHGEPIECRVDPPRIGHYGWFIDEHEDDVIRGIVIKLPKARGFLAGWSMGEGMITEVDEHVYDSARDAALAADSMAENMAEREREARARNSDEDDAA